MKKSGRSSWFTDDAYSNRYSHGAPAEDPKKELLATLEHISRTCVIKHTDAKGKVRLEYDKKLVKVFRQSVKELEELGVKIDEGKYSEQLLKAARISR